MNTFTCCDYSIVRSSDVGLKLVRDKHGFFFIFYTVDLIIPLPLVMRKDGFVCWDSILAVSVFDSVVEACLKIQDIEVVLNR